MLTLAKATFMHQLDHPGWIAEKHYEVTNGGFNSINDDMMMIMMMNDDVGGIKN